MSFSMRCLALGYILIFWNICDELTKNPKANFYFLTWYSAWSESWYAAQYISKTKTGCVEYRVFHNCWNKAIWHKSRIL